MEGAFKLKFNLLGNLFMIFLYFLAQKKFSYLQEHEIQKLKQEEGIFKISI